MDTTGKTPATIETSVVSYTEFCFCPSPKLDATNLCKCGTLWVADNKTPCADCGTPVSTGSRLPEGTVRCMPCGTKFVIGSRS